MAKKLNARYNTRKKPLMRFVKPSLIILIVSMGLGFIAWYVSLQFIVFLKADISWDIDPQLPISQSVLSQKIQPLISDSYWLDLQKITQILQQQPWIGRVDIERILRNSIKISLESKRVAMRWENVDCQTQTKTKITKNNCTGYISTTGTLFIPQQSILKNATLAIAKNDAKIIKKLYQDYQHYQKLSKSMIIRSFSQTHIQKLIFEPNIKVILGAKKQSARLIRFLKAYRKLRKKTKIKNATFDMRYPKGFSVRY